MRDSSKLTNSLKLMLAHFIRLQLVAQVQNGAGEGSMTTKLSLTIDEHEELPWQGCMVRHKCVLDVLGVTPCVGNGKEALLTAKVVERKEGTRLVRLLCPLRALGNDEA